MASQGGDVSGSHSHHGNLTVSYPDMNNSIGQHNLIHGERGNDGLVTVSSAKWGKFLGIIEGCDHWEVRGARGLGADWDEGWGKMWREWMGRLRLSNEDKAESVRGFLGGTVKQEMEKQRERQEKEAKADWASQNGLATKFDLERFYVAISRKLYDEGL